MFTLILSGLLAISAPECRDCGASADERKVLVFMSTSVPLESWKSYSQEMEKTGGAMILRGFPDNSLPQYAAKIQELRNEGVTNDIDLDPALFERYGIEAVPSLVIRDGEQFDKVTGNYALEAFLGEAASSGDVKTLSEQTLQALRNTP